MLTILWKGSGIVGALAILICSPPAGKVPPGPSYTLADLGTLGGNQSEAVSINNQGQVVGWSDTRNGTRHAFLWEKGKMTDLNILLGNAPACVGINDKGQVLCSSITGRHMPSPRFSLFSFPLFQGKSMVSLPEEGSMNVSTAQIQG